MSGAGGPHGGPEAPGGALPQLPVAGYEPYRGSAGLARWTAGLLIALAVSYVLLVVSELAGVSQVVPDARETSADATANELVLTGLIALVQGGLSIAVAVLFIVWLYRVYKNLPPLGAQALRYGAGWTIGAWFIPIFDYIRPKQIVNDVWRASDPEQPPDQSDRWRGAPLPGLYRLWWTAWIAVAVVGVTAATIVAIEGEGTLLSELLYYLSYLTTIAAAMLAAQAVRRTTERQESRARKLGWIPA